MVGFGIRAFHDELEGEFNYSIVYLLSMVGDL
jgi:hypothetical protein